MAAGYVPIPLGFGALGSASTSRSLPGRRALIWEELIARRGKIATRYTVRHAAVRYKLSDM